MNSNTIFEQYKILIDIYYKELTLFYTKITIFNAIQLGVFTGVIINYGDLIQNTFLFFLSLVLMIILSFFQILISKRGYIVNNALINEIAQFETNNNYNLLSDFSNQANQLNGVKKMNFPSYLFIYLGYIFMIIWISIMLFFILPILNIEKFIISCSVHSAFIEYIFLSIFSILYAVSMKISDLLDEHEKHFFKGDKILFGVLCGLFGCVLIVYNTIVANVIFAMIIGFVVRKKIDYLNHIIAFIIISSCFLYFSQIIYNIYFPFLIAILILGLIKELKYIQNKSTLVKIICKMYLYIPIVYALPSLIYSILSSDWKVFTTFFLFDLSYNITRIIGEKNTLSRYYN